VFSGKRLRDQTNTLTGGHEESGDAESEPAPYEAANPIPANDGTRALTSNLMERVCEPSNLNLPSGETHNRQTAAARSETNAASGYDEGRGGNGAHQGHPARRSITTPFE
jgi:hypothetical protein